MGNTTSQYDKLFCQDDFDEIIESICLMRSEPENFLQLQHIPTVEEWNVISTLCRTSPQNISREFVAELRGRLMGLWSEGDAPRQSTLSALLMSTCCFIEGALGGGEATTVAARIESMVALISEFSPTTTSNNNNTTTTTTTTSSAGDSNSNFNNINNQSPGSSSEFGDSSIIQAMKWSAKLASYAPQYAWYEMQQEMKRLQSSSSSSSSSLRSWLVSLIMTSYCVLLIRKNNNTLQKLEKEQNQQKVQDQEVLELYSENRDARMMGFHTARIALRSKQSPTSNQQKSNNTNNCNNNGIAEVLWDFIESSEQAASLYSVECVYSPQPVVRDWSSISNSFVGQNHAVREIADIFRAREVGVQSRDKPVVLLFFGPSGHGKTELGRWIARILSQQRTNNLNNNNHSTFTSASSTSATSCASSSCASSNNKPEVNRDPESTGDLLILNMTNFSSDSSLNSLIDPPAGIKGEGGLLKNIEENPNLVVVADEFEKSTAAAVNNLWLPCFEVNGKLASAKDPRWKVSTNNVTFVLTCNLMDKEITAAKEEYHAASEQGRRQMRDRWISMCSKRFCEVVQNNALLNRITKIIPFVPFTETELRQYVDLQLTAFQRQQLEHGRELYYSRAVVDQLATRVQNFHTQSVRDCLRAPMLKAVDAKESCVLVTTRHPHPIRDAQEGGDHRTSSSSASNFLSAHVGVKEIESLGGSTALKIAEWGKEKRLCKLRDEFLKREKQQQEEEEQRKRQVALEVEEQRKKQQQAEERLEQEETKRREQQEIEKKKKEQEEKVKQQQLEKEEQEKRLKQQKETEEEQRKREAEEERERERERQKKHQQQKEEEEREKKKKKQQEEEAEEEQERERQKQRELEQQQQQSSQTTSFLSSMSSSTATTTTTSSSPRLRPNLQEEREYDFEKETEKIQEKELMQEKDHKTHLELLAKLADLEKKNFTLNYNVDTLKNQVKDLNEEKLTLQEKIKNLEHLVENLQTVLAISLLFGLGSMFLLSFFVPLKAILFTVVLVLALGNYLINNFTELLKTAILATWRLLGPKKSILLLLFLLFYSGALGWIFQSDASPCTEQNIRKTAATIIGAAASGAGEKKGGYDNEWLDGGNDM